MDDREPNEGLGMGAVTPRIAVQAMSEAGDPIGRFLANAARRPDHPAIQQGETITTYGDLARMARRLAACIVQANAQHVLIGLPQGPAAYAAIIGALLGGATYVPLNAAAPASKLRGLVAAIRPDAIVADPAFVATVEDVRGDAVLLDPDRLPDGMLEGSDQRHATAYMIMTSGSSGAPKGVVISTAALAHYVGWLCDSRMFRAEDRVSQFPSISFDLSVLDIYGALSAGATLVPPTGAADRWFPADFARRAGISVWVSVPSMIDLVVRGRQATQAMLGGVRMFVFCGEALRPTHLGAIFTANPDAAVANLYGPTEATCSMTALMLGAGDYRESCRDSVALGEAIPGMGLHLVGGAHPDEGELVITGPQLATEYWCDATGTTRAFRPVEIGGAEMRGYFTGDWAERDGGRLYFKGRVDSQLKINGYRVEAGEVIARLADEGWPVACVLKHRGRLTAVVEQPSGRQLDEALLRTRLGMVLEPHAVPLDIEGIPQMPRNENDKLDVGAVRDWLDRRLCQ